MHDFNTQIANFAKTAENMAFQCEQQARRISVRIPDGTPAMQPEMIRRRDAEAARERAEAKRWKERQEMAERGWLLVDGADASFMLDPRWSELRTNAAREHRLRFVETPGRSNELLGTTPVQPGTEPGPPSWGSLQGA